MQQTQPDAPAPTARRWRWRLIRFVVVFPIALWLIFGLSVTAWHLLRHSPNPALRQTSSSEGSEQLHIRMLLPERSLLSQTWRGDLRYLWQIYRSGHVWLQAPAWQSDGNPSGSYGFYFPGTVIGEDLAAGEATHQIALQISAEQASQLQAAILGSQQSPPRYTLIAINEHNGNCISWIIDLLDGVGVAHPLAKGDEPYDLRLLPQLQAL